MTSVHEHRKRHKRSSSKPHSSQSHNVGGNHDARSVSHSATLDTPAALEELRTARIAYLETPALERSSKMKYEYTRTVAVRTAVSTSEPSTKRRRRSHSARRTKSSVKTASKSKDADKSEAHSEHGEYRYVYRSPCGPVTEQEEKTSENEDDNQPENKPMSNPKPVSNRRSSQRRHTAPVPETRSSSCITERTPPVSSLSSLRKSLTASPEIERPSIRRSARSEVADSDTVSIASTTRKRSSSVFGGLFSPKPVSSAEPKVSCLTCGDDVVRSRTAKLPCTHRMCTSCLKRIFKLSITDPAHMPPKCCTDHPIDVKHVDKLFDEAFKKIYNRKFKEYNAKNKIYCPMKGCGQWIQPKHMSIDRGRKVGKCPTCKTLVCALCNQKMHKSRDCPKDPATKQFAEIAKQAGWQKCYNCSATVELKEGCNHMTCRCTAEFCMVCGLKWKSCDCPWFNYDQLDTTGDPVRYQQELDRRREQEHRDAELARRMEAFDIDDEARHMFGFGNAGGHHMNQNFIQQAREALTANYQAADQAARGLLNGFFTGRENPNADPLLAPPPIPTFDNTPEQALATRQYRRVADPQENPTWTSAGVPVLRRSTNRRRRTLQTSFEDRPQTDAEQDQERRMRRWADDVPGHL